MKGFLLGSLTGLVIIALSGLLAATALIHPIIPLVIACVMVVGLFGYVGYRSQK